MSSLSQLKSLLSSHYNLGQILHLEKIDQGQVNVSFEVKAVKRGRECRYFLRQYRLGIEKAEIEFEHSIIRHVAKEKSLPIPGLIVTRSGDSFVEIPGGEGVAGKQFFAVLEFLPGKTAHDWDRPDCSEKELESAAGLLARYHGAVSDLVPTGQRKELKIIDLLPVIAAGLEQKKIVAGESEFDRCLQDHLDDIVDYIRSTIATIRSHQSAGLVQLAIHGDFHPGNLKFRDGHAVGLFDFDWTKIDLRCFELALAVVYFCSVWDGERDGILDLNRADLFLKAYGESVQQLDTIPPLAGNELDMLPHLLKAANIYILNWVVEDYFSNPVLADKYTRYLQHNIRLMEWMQGKDNRKAVETLLIQFKT